MEFGVKLLNFRLMKKIIGNVVKSLLLLKLGVSYKMTGIHQFLLFDN